MTTSESRRLDLCNALTDILGSDYADTLMNNLPSQTGAALATTSDLETLSLRFDHFDRRLDDVNQRLDRIVLTLAAGLVAIVATLIAQGFS